MELLLFRPLYQERVWGGRWFASALARELPSGAPIGESWELVDRPEANSVVARGPLAGRTLRQVLETEALAVMGPNWDPARPFPILIKWLDCQARLSLQVHPPAAVAPALGGEPKTENWFVVATEGDSAVLAGLKAGVTRAQFAAALADDAAEPLVPRLPTQVGDSLFVESGRLHAIDGGNLILEIQQNSDTTYRVYDWGRVGLDGKPRQLHVDASMQSIDFTDVEPAVLHSSEAPGRHTLAKSDVFNLFRLNVAAGEKIAFPAEDEPRILSVVRGTLHDERTGEWLTTGDNALLPYAGAVELVAQDATVALVTESFVS